MARAIALLVNPTSGRGRGHLAGRRAAARLREAGLDVHEMSGRDVREAADLAREAVESGVDALVVVGGDGMVHLGVQVVTDAEVPLGVIPAGTGNDFARALRIPLDDVAAAADVVVAGHHRRIDLGRSGDEWFACIVAAGFDARVNDRVNRMRWFTGRRRYDIATMAELGVFRPIPYSIELDGEVWETDAMLVAVANTPSYGGGILVTPNAEIDDGLFDVIVVEPVSRATLIRLFPKVRRGEHLSVPEVTVRRAARVVLEAPHVTSYVDGERLGPLPRTFQMVPKALDVLAPSTSPDTRRGDPVG
jgi:diacylglycerol kinase (ATP)